MAQRRIKALENEVVMNLETLLAEFPKLDLLKPDLKVEWKGNGLHVWDRLRKKWLLLTPEEWVRQHVQHWLITVSHFPRQLLSSERSVKDRKRADLVGFNRMGNPMLLVECKAADVAIDEKTAQQAMVYHQTLNIPFLWLTNGRIHWVFEFEATKKEWKILKALPDFEQMNQKSTMTPLPN